MGFFKDFAKMYIIMNLLKEETPDRNNYDEEIDFKEIDLKKTDHEKINLLKFEFNSVFDVLFFIFYIIIKVVLTNLIVIVFVAVYFLLLGLTFFSPFDWWKLVVGFMCAFGSGFFLWELWIKF